MTQNSADATPPPSSSYVIWDLFVRIFHWSLAACFLCNYFITQEDSLHEWIGYAAATLVICRIIWGFIGTGNARFSSFIPTLSHIKSHLQELRKKDFDATKGHNPLGGAMVLFLLAAVIFLGVSGFLMENIDYFWGEDWLQELHTITADITMIAVVIHVLAVIFMQKFTGIKLVEPMITGTRKHPTHK